MNVCLSVPRNFWINTHGSVLKIRVFWGVTRVDWYTVLSLRLTMKQLRSFRISVTIYRSTRSNTSKDPNLQQYPWVPQVSTRDHLKFVIFNLLTLTRTRRQWKILVWERYKCHLMYSPEFVVYAEIKKHIHFDDKMRREETTRRIHRRRWETIL